MNLIDIINEIHKIDGDSLLDKALEYCHKNNIDIQELGDILSESEEFKQVLLGDCIKYKIIRSEEIDIEISKTEDICAW